MSQFSGGVGDWETQSIDMTKWDWKLVGSYLESY